MKEEIRGAFLKICRLSAQDIQEYLSAFSPAVRHALRVSSCDLEYIYLQEQLKQQEQGQTDFYAIRITQTNALIGAIEIRNPAIYRGHLYTWIHERFWGTGYFKQALYLVTQEYFSTHSDRYITAYVDQSNKRSYKAFKKCGFIDSAYHIGRDEIEYELLLPRNQKHHLA